MASSVMLGIAIYRAKPFHSEHNISGVILGILLLIILVMPQVYYKELSQAFNKEVISLLYLIYVGVLLILSYKVPSKTFLFRILSELTSILMWPRSNKWPLIWGVFLIIVSPIIYFFGQHG